MKRSPQITKSELRESREIVAIAKGELKNTRDIEYNPLIAHEIIKSKALTWISLLLLRIQSLEQKARHE